MDIAILAARRQVAGERALLAAERLADRFGLAEQHAALTAARHKDKDLDRLYREEAIADFLEALDARTGPAEDLPDHSQRLGAMTVAEVEAEINDADAETLDALENAERNGKARKGVLAAIETRRTEFGES